MRLQLDVEEVFGVGDAGEEGGGEGGEEEEGGYGCGGEAGGLHCLCWVVGVGGMGGWLGCEWHFGVEFYALEIAGQGLCSAGRNSTSVAEDPPELL